MAFAKGTQVDPRLRAIDFSPMSRATDDIIAGYQSMGKSIDSAIKGFQEKKEEEEDKKVKRESIDFVLQNANLPKEYQKGTQGYDSLIKTLEKEDDFLSSIESVIELGGASTGVLYTESDLIEGRGKGLNIKGVPTGRKNEQGEMLYQVDDVGTYAPNIREVTTSEDPFLKLGFETMIQPLVENSALSQGKIDTANLGIKLLSEQDVQTGVAEDLILNVKGLGNQFFGMDFDISNQELFRNQIEPTMMNFIQNTKGAISDREMAKFQSWSPSLEKTQDGNLKIITNPYELNDRVNDYLMLPENQIVDYVNSEFDKIKKTKSGGKESKTQFTSEEEILNLDTSNYEPGTILYLNGKIYGATD
jgi:hypothetical protein